MALQSLEKISHDDSSARFQSVRGTNCSFQIWLLMIRNTLAFVPHFWQTGRLAKWLTYLSLSNAATSSNLIVCSFLKSHVTVIVKEEGWRGAAWREERGSKGAQMSRCSKETLIKGIFIWKKLDKNSEPAKAKANDYDFVALVSLFVHWRTLQKTSDPWNNALQYLNCIIIRREDTPNARRK